jgi:hypothetical protein
MHLVLTKSVARTGTPGMTCTTMSASDTGFIASFGLAAGLTDRRFDGGYCRLNKTRRECAR